MSLPQKTDPHQDYSQGLDGIENLDHSDTHLSFAI